MFSTNFHFGVWNPILRYNYNFDKAILTIEGQKQFGWNAAIIN